MNEVKDRTVLVGSIIFSVWHVIDVVLDLLYIKETPMETDYYYYLLAVFMIFPVIFVIIFAFKETLEHERGPSGFIIFLIGGLTNSMGLILEKYYKIDD